MIIYYKNSMNELTDVCFKENNYMYSCIPFVIMIVCNCLLIHELRNSKRKMKSPNLKKLKSTSVTVLIVNTLFIVLSAPAAIANAFYVPLLFESRTGIAILFFFDCLTFTFHSFNFVTLFFSNKQFSREVKFIFSGVVLHKTSTVHTTDRPMNETQNNKQKTRRDILNKTEISIA